MAICRTAVAEGPGWEPVYFIYVSAFANSGMYVWIFMGEHVEVCAVVLQGLRETGAAITLNHSFASLAGAPVEKCFKKQNK